MSTRWYPFYQLGNPQRRVFLPNFWMKLVKPTKKVPNNIVQFHCSMEMTKFDIKNYLEKIYDVHPIKVNTRIALGKTRVPDGFVVKDDDVKVAYVTLPKTESFTFPDVLPKDEEKVTDEQRVAQIRENFQGFTEHNKMPGFPSWFRV